jgi:exonuclease VII small subunit
VNESLQSLVDELEAAAARLRSGELDAEEAAALVERCAELAARIGAALDAESRAASQAPAAGQERLL